MDRSPFDFWDYFECQQKRIVPGVSTPFSSCRRGLSDRAKNVAVPDIDPDYVYEFRVRHKARSFRTRVRVDDHNHDVAASYDPSPWQTVTVGGPPKAPANLRITRTTSTSVTLAWDAVTETTGGGAVVGNVRYSVSSNWESFRDCETPDGQTAKCFNGEIKWAAHTPGTSATVTGLRSDRTYKFSVLSRTDHRVGQSTGWVVTSPAPRTTRTFPQPQRSQLQPEGAKRKANITVTAADPVTVNEGGAGAYTVGLGVQPTGDVVVQTASDNADVTTQPASLTFTPDNWQTPQTVSVRASHDDDVVNDAATVSHSVSGDSEYDSIGPSVNVAVTDDDTAGVTVSTSSLSLTEGGTATYTVVLDAAPIGQVLIGPFTYDAITAQPEQLTFTSENWRTPQTVTVSAAHDDDADDEQTGIWHFIGAGTGTGYMGVAVAGVDVSVTDDDEPEPAAAEAGVTVTPTELGVNEGESATYTVVLDAQPSGNVLISMLAGDGLTAQPSSLTFTPDNWSAVRTVTVSAAQDDDTDDNTATVSHAIAAGPDSGYVGVTAPGVEVSITDDDENTAQPAQAEPEPGSVTLSASNLPIREGASATYTVALDVEPTENVTITVSSSNGDVTTQPPSLTFTTDNWQSAQTVTVRAGQDSDESNDSATLSHAASGGNYDGVSVASVTVSVTDDDGDRAVLETFYNATGGGSWTNNSNWLSAKPLNQWHGVTANGQGQVTHLALRNNGLSGSLPSQLGQLDSLQVLSLDRNSISGSLPSSLGNLSNLTRLAMNRNSLSGSIPSQLGSLSNLSIIGLARNNLSGGLPTSLGNLNGLTRLSLHDNTALSGALPSGFTGLSNLQRLAIANTGLCAPDDEAFTAWLDTVSDKPGGVATCE